MAMKRLEFGSLAPPLSEQIDLPEAVLKEAQADADAVSRLHCRGLISAEEAQKARDLIRTGLLA